MTLTPEQISLRKNGVGSSEVSTICGWNPYKDGRPGILWLKKRGLWPDFEGNERCDWGAYLEEHIGNWFADRTGLTLEHNPDTTLVHPEHSYMMATPDFWVVKENDFTFPGIVEVKNVSYHAAWAWKDGSETAPPAYVQGQLQWQMHIARACGYLIEVGYIVAQITGDPPQWWEFEYDEKLCLRMEDRVREFWSCVLFNVAIGENEDPYLKTFYPRNERVELDLPTQYARKLGDGIVKKRIKIMETQAELDTLEGSLKNCIGKDAGFEGIASWRADKKGTRVFRLHGDAKAEVKKAKEQIKTEG